MTAVLVILAVLAALLLLLAIPVRAVVLWRTGSAPQVTLRWLCFRYLAYPRPEKPKTRPKQRKKASAKKPKPPKTPEEFAGQLGVVVDLLAAAKGAAGFLLRRFKLHKIRLDLIVAKGNAARTAIAYGQVNAAVYGTYAVAKNFLKLGKPEISIRPNFTADEGDALLEIGGRLSPLAALGAALRGGGAFLLRLARRTLSEKQAQKNNDI